MFDRATIRLGIGPHSSCFWYLILCGWRMLIVAVMMRTCYFGLSALFLLRLRTLVSECSATILTSTKIL